MSGRTIAVASVPHGPHDPTMATPARQPGSVRRTTSLDLGPAERGGPMAFVGRGRDLRTSTDGSATVLDEVVVRGSIAPSGELVAVDAEPPDSLGGLVGASVRRGFRPTMDAALPAHREGRTLLHQLLDDLPITLYVSGYADMRELPAVTLAPASVERMVDVCAGWQGGATMMELIATTGQLPTPLGPPAPNLATTDPVVWHDMPELEPGQMRRRRRLDMGPGDPFPVTAMFRDSLRPREGHEEVLHEYEVEATIDGATLVVASAIATARVLPWPECPRAAASAGDVVGQPAADLRRHVLDELTGIETCTHLNDVLRSLADVVALAGDLP